MNEESRTLAQEIIHCPMVAIARTDTSRACYEIVSIQKGEFQLPEPWNGNINAPILFLSSNPGYDPEEDTVTANWSDVQALEHFEKRLVYEKGLISHFKKKDSSPKNYPDFLTYIKGIATEILGREADPEQDYCSTEIVHCKSNDEEGVACATRYCADRYLERMLNVSGAKVVILVGSTVLWQFKKRYKTEIDYGKTEKMVVGDREFIFTSIYHNNARFAGVGEKRKETVKNILYPLQDYLGIGSA